LEAIRDRTAIEIAVDGKGGCFALTGSRSSLHHAMRELHEYLPCPQGEKCKNSACSLCHQFVLPVKGVANARFVGCPENRAAIRRQTEVEIAWRPDAGEVEICGSQKQVFEAKQHLKRLTLCTYSNRCKNISCPFWHTMDCDMTHPLIRAVPAGRNRFVSSVAKLHEVELTNCESSITVSGPRNAALSAMEALTFCRYNDVCTNRACAYLHVWQLSLQEGVEIGMLIGPGGEGTKEIETKSGSSVHVDTACIWAFGSQNAVFQAGVLLRDRMRHSTKCRYGRACTNPKCEFIHPKSHTQETAKAWAYRQSPDQEWCKYGSGCRFKRTCTFRHF